VRRWPLLNGLAAWVVGLSACTATAAMAVGPAVVERTLASGATVLVSEQPGLPIVVMIALLDAGSRRDPEGSFGLANLTAMTLTEGAAGRSANQIAAAIEFVGGGLSASANVDYATVSLRVLRKDLDVGLELFADVLLQPSFAEAEIARAREATVATLRENEDDPTSVAAHAFSRELYGPHPYAHPVRGVADSVAAIDRDSVQDFYRTYYGPRGAVIVVVGDVRVDDVEARLATALRGWHRRPQTALRVAEPEVSGSRRIEIDRPVTQASVVIGHRGVARSNPDYEALTVVNYVLGGGGFSSRLMEKIRSEAGLVYSVSSYFSGGQLPGSFRVIMQTKNESLEQAIAMARAEIEKVRDHGITRDELDDAKRYLTGSFPLGLDSDREIAAYLASTWFLGLGSDAAERYLQKIEAVSLEDARRVAAEYLHPDALLEVVVADIAKTRVTPRPVTGAADAGGESESP